MQNLFSSKTGSSKKALLLGAGFVVKPTLTLLSEKGVEITVACRTLDSAQKLSKGVKGAKAISLNVEDETALDAEVSKVHGTQSIVVIQIMLI